MRAPEPPGETGKTPKGLKKLRQLYELYGFLLERYGGKVVEETWDASGCVWEVQIYTGSRFRFTWDERDGPPVLADVLLGCPDSQSPLNRWESVDWLVEFLADLEGRPRPSRSTTWAPEVIEAIVEFIHRPKYVEWCAEYREWRRKRIQEIEEWLRKKGWMKE